MLTSDSTAAPSSAPAATSAQRTLSTLVTNNITALERAQAVIKHLPEAVFTDKSEAAFSASVGEHFRHIIEHYQQFLDGWRAGLVDYDRRARNAQLETNMASARAAISDLCLRFRALPDDLDLSQPVAVCNSDNSQMLPSSLSRELLFLHSHSVHHFAIIVLILKQRGISIDENLGFAPSTLTHRGIAT